MGKVIVKDAIIYKALQLIKRENPDKDAVLTKEMLKKYTARIEQNLRYNHIEYTIVSGTLDPDYESQDENFLAAMKKATYYKLNDCYVLPANVHTFDLSVKISTISQDIAGYLIPIGYEQDLGLTPEPTSAR